jgi:hypothetical protein
LAVPPLRISAILLALLFFSVTIRRIWPSTVATMATPTDAVPLERVGEAVGESSRGFAGLFPVFGFRMPIGTVRLRS